MRIESVGAATVPVGTPARPAAGDRVEVGAPPDGKALVTAMMRRCPDAQTASQIVELLSSRYPAHCIEKVANYGVHIEIYGDQEPLPPGMEELASDDILGGFNPQTKVIGLRLGNANAFTLLHEFAHALDAAVGGASERPAWQTAYQAARAQGHCVRQNATHNPKEYLADDVAAYLIPDQALEPLRHMVPPLAAIDRDHYSNGRLLQCDPQGWHLAEDLLRSASR